MRLTLRGFTLLEVLVAMLVVAIGMTGNYLAFARSLQQQQHGIYQARAVSLAASVTDTLLVGRAVALADEQACNSGLTIACAAIEWRDSQLAFWQSEISNQLPNASMRVTNTADALLIEINWRDTLSPIASNLQVRAAL